MIGCGCLCVGLMWFVMMSCVVDLNILLKFRWKFIGILMISVILVFFSVFDCVCEKVNW